MATTSTMTAATPVPMNTCKPCVLSGPPRDRWISTASSTASRAPRQRCARASRRTYRSISVAPPTQPSRSPPGTPTPTCSGASRWPRSTGISAECAAAKAQGRDPRFSVSFRPIVADTEEAAWKRAAEVLEQVRENRARLGLPLRDHQPQNVGSQRLLAAAEQGEVLDSRLWTGVARLTGARWNSTALVGTPSRLPLRLASTTGWASRPS